MFFPRDGFYSQSGSQPSGMSAASCFPAIARDDARVLVLGSMPGVASLQAQQYYAHPRNAFWYILGSLFGFDADASYAQRTQALKDNGIALWDVLQSCVRPGSLDAAIENDSMVANDFAGFFARHPAIHSVFFNGATAEREFMRRVLPGLETLFPAMNYRRLPSTSPAMASLNREQKLQHWQVLRDVVQGADPVRSPLRASA